MTAKKSRAKKTVADVVEEQDGIELESIAHPGDDDGTEIDPGDINPDALVEIDIEIPEVGPDYHITPTGEILLNKTGEPVPEDHHIHPAHRLLALARKDATR